MARFGAFLDACVLVPAIQVDTLLRLAEAEFFRPSWTATVLGEVNRALRVVHPELEPRLIEGRLQAMRLTFPDADTTGWESLVPALRLPDPGDRQVLAGAIRARADVIVTNNLTDFPDSTLRPFGLSALSADEFLLDQLDLDPSAVIDVIQKQAAATRNPALGVPAVLGALTRAGAGGFATDVARRMV
ncbi:PIN domain-containing protein [Curtobacterium sp. Leaf261]|uniref:PIN domain-containing protein n=1 Tax=Curtobacterium sp. Leaf261 TaxID=1736311 RepID=UPI0006F8458E|nr:PIN domain-containing protein [Curtobacterium sp. Leaf261]KQO59740.1 hypothetical protein ASF23_15735 [Curtobacterium sp. Leaf261]